MQVRRVQEIVIVYTVPGDDTPRQLRLQNPDGQVIDGIIWNRALMERLRYAAGSQCVPPKVGQGTKPWRLQRQPGDSATQAALSAEATAADETSGDSCVWLHDEACNWDRYCES